jgi:hypothetical protein
VNTATDGLDYNKGIYAIGAGLKINLPMLAKGDALYLTANYANGMTEYTTNWTSFKSSANSRDVGGGMARAPSPGPSPPGRCYCHGVGRRACTLVALSPARVRALGVPQGAPGAPGLVVTLAGAPGEVGRLAYARPAPGGGPLSGDIAVAALTLGSNGLLTVGLQSLFHLIPVGRQTGRKFRMERRQAFRICRIQTRAPHMPEDFFTNKSVGLTLFIARRSQTQQAQRVEGVCGWQLQRGRLLVGQPQHLAVSPIAFARYFCGAQLAKVFEHGTKHHRVVMHALTDAF